MATWGLVGLGVGMLAGLVVGATVPVDPGCGDPGGSTYCINPEDDRVDAIVYGSAYIGSVGGMLGAAVGALVKTERWREVDSGLRSPSPSPNVASALSFRSAGEAYTVATHHRSPHPY